jgi:hypothetical protein
MHGAIHHVDTIDTLGNGDMNMQPAHQVALGDDAEVRHQLVVASILGDQLLLPHAEWKCARRDEL